jgi:hypothetical protein
MSFRQLISSTKCRFGNVSVRQYVVLATYTCMYNTYVRQNVGSTVYIYVRHIVVSAICNYGIRLSETFIPGKNVDPIQNSKFDDSYRRRVCTTLSKRINSVHTCMHVHIPGRSNTWKQFETKKEILALHRLKKINPLEMNIFGRKCQICGSQRAKTLPGKYENKLQRST